MSDPTDFQKLLIALGRKGEVIRICRAKDGHPFSAMPVEYARIPEHLEALNGAGFNVWFELNPSAYTLPAGRSNASDITGLSALYADLDFKPAPQGLGSPDACLEVISDLSSALGTQPAVIVSSGGGMQPYWPIADAQISSEDSRKEIAAVLRRWGLLVKQFAQANHGDADNVFDLPRILRVPGSVNHKNDMPKPTSAQFSEVSPVTLAEVVAVLDDYEIPVVDVEVSHSILSPISTWDWADKDCPFVYTVQREIVDSVPTSRHHWALKWAALLYGMIRSGCVTEAGFYGLREALIDRFKYLLAAEGQQRAFNSREMESILKTGQLKAESWTQMKLGLEMRQHVHDNSEMFTLPPLTEYAAPPPEVIETPTTQVPVVETVMSNVSSIFSKQRFSPTMTVQGALALDTDFASQQRLLNASHTELGNAERFGAWSQGRFIHVVGMGWQQWDGERWVADSGNGVQEAMKDLLMQGLLTGRDDADRAWMKASMSRNRIKNSIELAMSLPSIAVPASALDSNAYELNTPSGILDLRAGEIRKPNPLKDFHTKLTHVGAEEMEIPQFLEFLRWAMQEDPKQASAAGSRTRYLQRLFGLALIGKLLHHVFPIFLGGGANGKSALLSIWDQTLGDYSLILPPKFFVQKNGNEHPTALAQLRGARLATASEVPPGARFDEDLVKIVTGEQSIRARFLNQNFFTYENTCTFFLAANHAPSVVAGGGGMWRRVRKIDFRNHVPINRQDPTMADRIVAQEGPGILWWGMQGARDVLMNGLRDPESVIQATREYQLEEDMITSFLDSQLRAEEGMQLRRDVAYEVYVRWVLKQGMQPLSFVKFCREVVMLAPKANLGSKDFFTHTSLNVMSFEYAEED